MQLIHVQTNIQTIFGVLDDDGNVVSKTPITFELNKIDEANLKEFLDKYNEAKTSLSNQIPKQ